jgi:hypothetical protein
MIALMLCLILTGEKQVELRYTDEPPEIDGYIEDIWLQADSAYDFIQYRPHEGEPTTEPTVCYFLSDDNNLYVACRCYTTGRKPFASFKGFEDHIWFYLDTFNSKATAYAFAICLSGYYDDGLILEDGKVQDMSRDYVWFHSVKSYDDHYDMEVKIPYKSIRYKKGLTEWGINFRRYHIKDYEISHWTKLLQKDGLQISKCGTLTNVHPKTKGYYIELYPEAFFRYDRVADSTEYTPSLSFNFKWDFTSQSTLNGTVNPDFAHIEADPYQFNLSRYPSYLDERRPFFVEGNEVFRMSSLGLGFFQPLLIFYSRRVGKPLSDGGSVPILGGLKFINKGRDWNIGVLGAVTDSTGDEDYQGFTAARIRRQIFEKSEIGLLLSGAATSQDDYNYALGFDGAYRAGPSQFILQTALSDKNRKRGWAVSSGGIFKSENFIGVGSFIAVDDSFDVGDIGYVPWHGWTNLYIAAGPAGYPESGVLQRYYIEPGFIISQEPGSDEWSKLATIYNEVNFRNLWGFSLYCEAGKQYEADTNYFQREISLDVWSGFRTNMNINFGFTYSYCYNYRQNWISHQLWLWHWMCFVPASRISLITSCDFIIEYNPAGAIADITPIWTPRIEYKLRHNIDVSLYSEFVFETEEGSLSSTEIFSNRIGFLFAWNFLPKSWFYVAFNDYRENTGDGLELQQRIGAVKVKYLVYF